MRVLTCAATGRRLQAFHDRELTVSDQIAVGAHLEWCDKCAEISAELRVVGSALRAGAKRRAALSNDELAGLGPVVVTRFTAERDGALVARVGHMFDDMHLVWASLGAMTAAVVCVVLMLGMMRFATKARPDSLAAIISVLATPLECETGSDAPDESVCRARWAERFQRANETAEQDAVFALDSVVIHQDRLTDLAVLRANGHHATAGQARLIEGLLDTVCRARMEVQPSGNMLRLVDRATVRASKQQAIDLPLPPTAKKRAASQTAGARPVTA